MFGQRIAHKILLGYAIPLAVLVVAGVLVPAALSAILGRVAREYQRNARFVDQAQLLSRAAADSETYLRFYLIYGDDESQKQYRDSRENYQFHFNSVARFAASDPALARSLNATDAAYRKWLGNTSRTPVGASDMAKNNAARESREAFRRVRLRFRLFVEQAKQRREDFLPRAQAAERLRFTFSLVGPVAALLLALAIGRSISLGVTRPLETLTRGTEALERGQSPLAYGDGGEEPDDEVGDLKRAFARMARTIGQREAILRAQNEALGALNRRVEAVLNTTNDGIVMLDQGGGFSVVNQRLADLFGVDADVLLDQTFEQAGPLLVGRFKNNALVRARIAELLPDPEAIADETYEIVEPEYRVLRVFSAPVRGEAGDLLGRIFVFRDVTRETAVDRMKTEFMSVVSHELRTPLTAIKGYVDLMVSGQTGPLGELQHEFLTIVQSNTSRLNALINDMLDISRIESGRVEVQRAVVDYGKIVRETMQTLAQQAESKSIELSAPLPDALPPVSGDADRIAQVLVNLLSNALKYTPPGGQVQVSVEPADTFVTTCVADNGIGIGPEDQQRLFQKFFRADNSTTREAGGTGLGLAITKAILEKLRGSIWVESEAGQGTRFFFTLPTAAAADALAVSDNEAPLNLVSEKVGKPPDHSELVAQGSK